MSDDSSRRKFLKFLGVGAGAAASSCSGFWGGPSAAVPEGDARTDGRSGDVAGDSQEDSTGGGGDGGATSGDDTRASDVSDDVPDTGTCEKTGEDLKGPYHAEDAPERNELAPDDEAGERIVIEGRVLEPDCRTPVEGAMLDVWHANAEGEYYDASEDFRLRGQVQTDADGRYAIRTIKPGRYRQFRGLRPAHVHFIVSVPGFEPLTTQMYFAGDPYLGGDDSCDVCSSGDSTLIVDFQQEEREGEEVAVGDFEIVLAAE